MAKHSRVWKPSSERRSRLKKKQAPSSFSFIVSLTLNPRPKRSRKSGAATHRRNKHVSDPFDGIAQQHDAASQTCRGCHAMQRKARARSVVGPRRRRVFWPRSPPRIVIYGDGAHDIPRIRERSGFRSLSDGSGVSPISPSHSPNMSGRAHRRAVHADGGELQCRKRSSPIAPGKLKGRFLQIRR